MLGVSRNIWPVCAILLVALTVAKSVSDNKHDPDLVLIDKSGRKTHLYHGVIAQGETIVDINPSLQATDKDSGVAGYICGYTIYKVHKDESHPEDFPFKVELRDHKTGEADIVLRPGFDLKGKQEYYKFRIAAYDCGSPVRYSKRIHARVNIEETDNYEPMFDQPSYTVSVREGVLFDKILTIEAKDQDKSPINHDICRYDILTPDIPFVVNEQGNIKNTEKLDYSRKRNYILAVVAEDCGGKRSKPVMVNVKVEQACQPGWTGVDERIEYTPGSNVLKMFKDAAFNKCDAACEETKVTARVTLETKHIGKRCDRDTYSIKSQRKLCGASEGGIDLLPPPEQPKSWTKELPTDDGNMSDRIFSFDGQTTAVEVDNKRIDHKLNDHFTIATWMKHEEDPENVGAKEQILCNSDSQGMSRHHYSVFVHNCRLVLLLRQEDNANSEVFKHAEWRWKLPQVCDGDWHHYAVSVDFPKVRLYIDGNRFIETNSNPDVVDDWPLHHSNKVHDTKLVVGACWQGGSKTMGQHFRGYLAGLFLLKGKTESDRVIKCLNNCKEKLDFHAMSVMDSGMSVAFNSEMTEVTITGSSMKKVENLIKEMGYLNSRLYPTPGRRNIKIETDVKCGEEEILPVEKFESYVMVLKPQDPTISIRGVKNMARNFEELEEGVELFPDLTIVAETKAEIDEDSKDDSESKDANDENKTKKLLYGLDMCTVRVSPPLDDNERFIVPENLAKQLDLEIEQTDEGLLITGADKVFNYEDLIRHLGYYTDEPKNFVGRQFVLLCSEQDGRFVSNEFVMQLDVLRIQPKINDINVAHKQEHQQSLQMNKVVPFSGNELDLEEGKNGDAAKEVSTGTSAGIITIIVICVGFLVFMIVLGVIRIRAAHQRTQVVTVEEPQEMEWDDNWDNSTLNITVNPMEKSLREEFEVDQTQEEDSDSDDDDSHGLLQDEAESSEDEAEKVKDRDLEWDDSTLY